MSAVNVSLAALAPGERVVLGSEASTWTRSLSGVQIQTEIECNRITLAEIDAGAGSWAFVDESRAWVVYRLRALNEELALRRRLAAANPDGVPPLGRPPAEMKAELAEIKNRVDLAFYVECFGRVRLEKRGKTLWSCCPLPGHDDDTPSFHVDPERQLFHCFGCKRGGDLFEFARQIHQEPSFWVLLPALRALAGLPQPEAAKAKEVIPYGERLNAQRRPARSAEPERRAFEYRDGKIVSRA